MTNNNYFKTWIRSIFLILLMAGYAQSQAQTTVTVTCTGSTGSFKSGAVNSTGTKVDGNMTSINNGGTAPNNRGFAHFDLTVVPSGATVTAVTANFTTYSSTLSTAINNLYGFTGDPSVIAGATLYTNCGAGTSFNASAWSASGVQTKVFTAAGIAFIQANINSNNANIGYVRGSSNTYNIGGYPNDVAAPPNLVITYTGGAPCSGTPSPGNTIASVNPVCSGASLSLSLQNTTSGSGVTYQWSKDTGGGYSTIAGATNSSLTTTQSVATSYQCAVTCSGNTGTSNPVAVGMQTGFTCLTYCTPSTTNACSFMWITNFATSAGLTNISNPTACSGSAYGDYTATQNVTGNQGTTFNFSGTGNNVYGQGLAIWIDWNQNGSFTDAGENVFNSPTTGTPETWSGTIAIPAGATLGETRMRIRSEYVSNPTSPCTALTYGETEDYKVTVSAPSPCSGTPTPGNTNSTANPVCSGQAFTLSLQNVTLGSGVTYQWQSSPDNSTWTDVGGATQNTFATSAAVPTYYRCNVTCSGNTGASNSISITVNPTNCTTCPSYCVPAYTNWDGTDYIANVGLNGWNNPSGAPASAAVAYNNYTALSTTTIIQSTSYTLNITAGSYCCDYYTAFIDYNNNGSFSDAGETIGSFTNATAGSVISFPFTVPLSASAGSHRMRIVCNTAGTGIPCNVTGYGETEDYCITIAASSACSGTPAASAVTSTNSSPCPSASFTLNLSPTYTTTGLTFQWQSSPNGSTWTSIGGATNSSLATTQAVATYYQCIITCTASGQSATATSLLVGLGGACACATYCIPSTGCTFPDIISNVTFGTINRSSACDATSGGWSLYSSPNPSFQAGNSYSFSGTTSGDVEGLGVWIDYNGNGSFEDAGEFVYHNYLGTNPAVYTTTITIPAGAVSGSTRMRVRCTYSADPNTLSPASCANTTYGETEDYCITITPAPPCTGTPTPGNTVSTSPTACPTQSITLSLQNSVAASGISYNWQSSPDGVTWTNTGATNSTYTVTQAVTTWYQCIVACSFGGTATSTALQVTETVCYCTTPVYGYNLAGYGCSAVNGTDGDYIGNFSFAGINNSSGCTANAAPFYTYFSGLTASVEQTVSYPVSISAPAGGAAFQWFKVYIDFNDNGSFDDAGENVYDSGPISTSTNISTGNILIPLTAPLGTHRLRVRSHNGLNTNNNANSCSDDGNIGEVEDYNITIAPAPACSGTPTPGQTISSTPLACSSTVINLSVQNITGGTGVTYQWQSASDFAFTSPTNLGTNSTQTATQSATTYYRCQVTCSGNTGNSTPVLVTYSVPCYCTTQNVGSDGCGVQIYLNNVTFAGINNTSGCYSNIPYTSPYYSYFPGSPANCIAGQSYTFSASTPTNASSYYHMMTVWIDWNNNGSYEDAGDQVLSTAAGSSTVTNNLSGSILIPITTTPGTYKMRIRTGNVDGSTALLNSCSLNSVSGEMEDYDVIVAAPAACTGTPSAGNTVSTATTVCNAITFTLSMSVAQTASGITYQWQSSPDGSTWTDAAGATNTTYTTSQSVSTYYRCNVTCSGSGLTGSSSSLQISMGSTCECASYCIPVTSCTFPDIISNVTFDAINRNSSCDNATATNGGWSLYTSPNPSLVPGNTYAFSATTSGDVEGLGVWIDYNQNNAFDATEFVYHSFAGTAPATYTTNITIPASATPGGTRMRVRCTYNTDPNTLTNPACDNTTFGETEDYCLFIIAPNATSNSPRCEDDTLKLFTPATGISYSWTGPNGFTSTAANPQILHATTAASGLYTVVITFNGGGTVSASVTCTVNANPSVSSSADPAFCEGTQSLHLFSTAPTATGYAWTGPGGYTSNAANPVRTATTASMSGAYTVTVTDANTCHSSSSTSATVYALPPADITPIGSTNLCTGQTTTDLQATGGTGYSWSTGETTDLITVSTGGTYTVTVTDVHNCVNTDSQVMTESAAPAVPVVTPAGPVNLCSSDGGATYSTATLTVQNYSSNLLWSTSETTTSIDVNYADIFNVTYTDGNGCYSVSNAVVTNALLSSIDPTSVTSNAAYNNICNGNSVTLTANGGTLGDNAVWKWYTTGCGTGGGVSTGTSDSYTVSPSSTTTYYARAEGTCNNTACSQATITVSTAPPSGTVHVTSAPGTGCNGGVGLVSVNAVSGATFYSWNGTSGALYSNNIGGPFVAGPYQTSSPSVYVQFASAPPAGASGYNICGFAGNACGQSNTVCTWVRAKVSVPGAISGSIIGCPSTSSSYSIAAVAGADSYTWSVTGGASITLGQGTQTAQVTFPAGFTSAVLSVTSNLNCGFSSAPRTMSISNTPATPGAISGPASVCPSASTSFSVAAVTGAVSYTWTCSVPGSTVTPSGNSCSILFPAVIPAGSQVCVTATSSCGNVSALRCKGIGNGTPNVPGNISGPSNGQCEQSGVSYSITPVSGATFYTWTSTAGSTIVPPNNLSGVGVNFSSSFISTVISVTAGNSCGSSAARTITVTGAPGTPAAITGLANPCSTSVQQYQTGGSGGATSYNWTVPSGTVILGGQGSGTLLVQIGSISGNIAVTGSNTCGASGARTFPITIGCRQSQVDGTIGTTSATLYPNPTTGKTTVKFESVNAAKYAISVVDVTGRVILSDEMSAAEGTNMHELDLTSVAKGIYLVRMESAGEQTQLLKVTVE